MDTLAIDMETYFSDEYSLSRLTTESYVRDPRFETILCSVKLNDHPAFWLLEDRLRHFFDTEVDWANTACIVHHGHFDGLILSHHYGHKPAMWIDTLSMARVIDGPKAKNDLGSLAIRHNVGAKGDATRWAKGLHLADFTSLQLKEYGHYCNNDNELTYKLANLFLEQIPERELRLIDLTVRMFTEPRFVGNTVLLRQAVESEAARKQALLDSLALDKSEFTSKEKFATLLKACGVEPPTKPSPTTGLPIYAFAKTDPGMQELLEHDEELVRVLAETRLSSTSNIVQTRAQRFHDTSLRGLMPVYLRYGGAHTLRWSGGDSTNYQNMTSQSATRPEMLVLKEAHSAPAGHKIASADSSQIEARITAWLAGQSDLLTAFREKRDVYSEFASEQIYMRPVDRKKNKDDYIPGQLGKVSILGLGFGMWFYKFAAELLKGMLGAPPIQFTEKDIALLNIEPSKFLNNPNKVNRVHEMVSRLSFNELLIHCIVAEEIVLRYRNKNTKIVEFWDTCGKAIEAMAEGREFRFGPNGLLYTQGESIIMPSGVPMKYRGIQIEGKEATYFNGRSRTKIYGSLLTENCIAAGTKVLTDRGWICIEEIKSYDRVHDGVEFVYHGGVVTKSVQECVVIDDVYMTPDHEVLTNEGWKAASQNPRPYRPNLWYARSDKPGAHRREEKILEVSVPVRYASREGRFPGSTTGSIRRDAELRVYDEIADSKVTADSRYELSSSVRGVAEHVGPVPLAYASVVGQLRRSWDNGVQAMARLVSKLLGRYGADVRTRAGFEPDGQRQGLQQSELRMGYSARQHDEQEKYRTAGRRMRAESGNRNRLHYDLLPPEEGLPTIEANGTPRLQKQVLDIMDAGPRHRFVVSGASGPFIVHNCAQRLARDVVANQMLDVADVGYNPVTMTHDQFAIIAPDSEVEGVFQFMLQVMSTPPWWAPDLPLAAEGGTGSTYGSVK